MKAHEYQSKITHRIQIQVPLIVEMEVADCKNAALALAKALKVLAEALQSHEIESRYSWDGVWIDGEATFGDIRHMPMSLKPVPPEEIPPTEDNS